MRRDDRLRRDASVGSRLAAHVRDQGAQRIRVRRIKHARDLGGMDFALSHGPHCFTRRNVGPPNAPRQIGAF